MDSHLIFETHVKQLCKTSFFHLRNIARLRPMLTIADAEKLVHAFVSSRLDYCNALLIGIPGKNLQKLQYIQNSAARILMRVRKYDHITPILKSLHWLPVSFRIVYKVSLLTHQCIHGDAHLILRNFLPHNLQIVRSVLLHHIYLKPLGLCFALWEIELSAHLLRICGMLCLFIYGLHNLSMLLNVASKLTFLAKPLNKSIVGVVVLFN